MGRPVERRPGPEADPATPTIVTKEVDLAEPVGSRIMNWGTINNQGEMRPAQVSVATNGSLKSGESIYVTLRPIAKQGGNAYVGGLKVYPLAATVK